jgi:hypothetical protein
LKAEKILKTEGNRSKFLKGERTVIPIERKREGKEQTKNRRETKKSPEETKGSPQNGNQKRDGNCYTIVDLSYY